MRGGLIATGTAAVALVAVVVLMLTNALSSDVSGAAVATEATQLQNRIDDATLPVANAPAVKYTGEVVLPERSIQVGDLTVTSAGDVHGNIALDGAVAELLQLNGSTYVKGDAAFWDAALPDSGDPTVHKDTSNVAGQWALVSSDFLGVDLGQLLRPGVYGLGAQDQDARIDDDAPTWPVPERDQTPDARGVSTQDPTGLELQPEEEDGQTVMAGESPIRFNSDGTLYGFAGPVRSAPRERPTATQLKVTVLTSDEVKTFYATVEGLKDPLSRVSAPEIRLDKPVGTLVGGCSPSFCIVEYTFSNSIKGADRGTVTVEQSTTFSVNGGTVGTCTRTIEMPMNGRGNSSCPFPYATPNTPRIQFNAESNFKVSAHAEQDVKVIVESAKRGREIATVPRGKWVPGGYKTKPAARQYNQQITGAPSGFPYMVGDFPFDGVESDGTLLMTGAPGYDEHVGSGGEFDAGWGGTEQLLAQAKGASAAAGESPVRWVFAEGTAAKATEKLLSANGINNIDVVNVVAS